MLVKNKQTKKPINIYVVFFLFPTPMMFRCHHTHSGSVRKRRQITTALAEVTVVCYKSIANSKQKKNKINHGTCINLAGPPSPQPH